MDEKRDPRFKKLSTTAATVNLFAAIVSLVALVTTRWASLSGPVFGYMSPFMVCQDVHGGSDRCERGGLGPYRQTWASYVAAAGAVLCALMLCVGAVLGALVVAMHHAKHEICLKFRHATFVRMLMSSGAALLALVSVICFILETKIFLRMQSSDRTELSWSFYLEMLAFVMASAVGMIAGVEWRWARKLGGDPTIYTRDPEGVKADTIVNPNFREVPRNGTHAKKGPANGSRTHRPSGGVAHNSNGIAMTVTSGHPYMIKAQNGRANGRPNGRANVAFDPKRIPGRSSLRKPKIPTPTDDQPDTSDFALHNPAFANSSPVMKKKVRIFTQSTAV